MSFRSSDGNITLLLGYHVRLVDSEQVSRMSLGKQVFTSILSKVNALLIVISFSNTGFNRVNQCGENGFYITVFHFTDIITSLLHYLK